MANYLKPQSPLQHKDGDYFYPLTTIDQIITKDNTRLNAELVSVNLDDVIEGTPNKINADTLQGYTAEDFFNAKSSDVQLNYSVVGGLTEPSNPTKNMIWVQTDQPITGYTFRNTEPTDNIEGLIWFQTSDNSRICFARMTINNIKVDEVYPVLGYQYLNNEWINTPTFIYQNGEWVSWFPIGALYHTGVQIVPWEMKTGLDGINGWTCNKPIFNIDNIEFIGNASSSSTVISGIVTTDKIDISDFSNLTIEFEDMSNVVSGSDIYVQIDSSKTCSWNLSTSVAYASTAKNVDKIILPITVTGNYYISIFGMRMATFKIKSIILS